MKKLNYTEELSDYGDLMTIKGFKGGVECTCFTNDDGHGRLVKNNKMTREIYSPSQLKMILTTDATHIMWYNK